MLRNSARRVHHCGIGGAKPCGTGRYHGARPCCAVASRPSAIAHSQFQDGTRTGWESFRPRPRNARRGGCRDVLLATQLRLLGIAAVRARRNMARCGDHARASVRPRRRIRLGPLARGSDGVASLPLESHGARRIREDLPPRQGRSQLPTLASRRTGARPRARASVFARRPRHPTSLALSQADKEARSASARSGSRGRPRRARVPIRWHESAIVLGHDEELDVGPLTRASANSALERRRRSTVMDGGRPIVERMQRTQPIATGAACTHRSSWQNETTSLPFARRREATCATRTMSTSVELPVKSTTSLFGEMRNADPETAAYESTCGARARPRSDMNGDAPVE